MFPFLAVTKRYFTRYKHSQLQVKFNKGKMMQKIQAPGKKKKKETPVTKHPVHTFMDGGGLT